MLIAKSLTHLTQKRILGLMHSFLLLNLAVAFVQDFTDYTIRIFGYDLEPFYLGVFARVIPLIVLAYIIFPLLGKIFGFSSRDYFLNRVVFLLLLIFDAFTHITNVYALNYFGLLGWDKAMHLFLGLFSSLAFLPITIDYCIKKKLPNPVNFGLWFYLGILSIISIVWEIIELFLYLFADAHFLIPNKLDPAIDLTANLAGALLSGIFIWAYYKNKNLPQSTK